MEKRLKNPRKVLIRHPGSIKYYFLFRKLSNYTMVEYDALYQMRNLILDVDSNNVKGAIVETGCWNGGCGAYMAYVSKQNGSNRQTWLFDSFHGLPEATDNDEFFAKKVGLPLDNLSGHLKASIENVESISSQLGVKNNTHIIKGWFKDTIPLNKKNIGKIAILRLDGDLYDSTKIVLDELYSSVSNGGYVVVDDFPFPGCRKAIFDFFSEQGIAPYIKDGGKHQRTFWQK